MIIKKCKECGEKFVAVKIKKSYLYHDICEECRREKKISESMGDGEWYIKYLEEGVKND